MRHSKWDALLVALSMAHAAVLLAAPSIAVIALGLWWNSNTVSHNFLHLPFFKSSALNRLYSIFLSLLTGIPQGMWRTRHLAHHAAGSAALPRVERGGFAPDSLQAQIEVGLVLGLWGVIVSVDPKFFLAVYLPGYVLGLTLCALHGHFEHAHGTISHYGRLYNLSFFNDGYHVEHHSRPTAHWTRLPAYARRTTQISRWPAVLRWLEFANLTALERCVLHSATLQRYLLRTHERAFRALLPRILKPRTVTIVGGALFPRTALILQRLLPEARITIIDASADNIRTARAFLGNGVKFVHAVYDPKTDDATELIVIPLAFIGDRAATYNRRTAGATLVHDWIWARRCEGARVSVFLLKRLNLVQP
jgi:Fatty acid desaturase